MVAPYRPRTPYHSNTREDEEKRVNTVEEKQASGPGTIMYGKIQY